MMKLKIKFSFEYENADYCNKKYEMNAILHPALSNSQNAINVSEKLSAYVEDEIYKTLDELIMRK